MGDYFNSYSWKSVKRFVSLLIYVNGCRLFFVISLNFVFSFLNLLDHISHPLYIPTEQDILRTRVKTSGIVEQDFTLKGIDFKWVVISGNLVL